MVIAVAVAVVMIVGVVVELAVDSGSESIASSRSTEIVSCHSYFSTSFP